MNIEESIIDTTEIRQVNDGLRFRYDLAKNMLKPVTPKKSGLFSCKGREADEIKIYYDGSQRRSGVFYPNGVTGVYTYEATKQFRLRELVYKSDDTVHSSFKYSHDLNDFVTKVETVRSGIAVNAVQNYVYDKRNQLTSATKPMGTGTETFTYDGTGNRLQRDGESTDSTFDDVNRLLNDKKFTYEYDNNGNTIKKTSLTTGEVTENSWDHRNRKVGVTIRPDAMSAPVSVISYKYDAFNRRIEKNVNGTIIRYVYDRGDIHLEYDGNNTFQAKYVHSDNVDEPLRMERPDNPYKNDKFPVQEFYYHRDRLGNITEITDFEGTVVQRYVYDAFGKISIFDKDGNAITPSSANYLKSPYAFTGREYDPETRCYYYRARYYCPDMARYISEDPIGFAGLDENLYRYTGNNSINRVDPFGLFWPGFEEDVFIRDYAGKTDNQRAIVRYQAEKDFEKVSQKIINRTLVGGAVIAGAPAVVTATPHLAALCLRNQVVCNEIFIGVSGGALEYFDDAKLPPGNVSIPRSLSSSIMRRLLGKAEKGFCSEKDE